MTIQNTATLDDVCELARTLHEGQIDKGGMPYFNHVEAVAFALQDFGIEAMCAGYLHDAIEDTGITAEDLISKGIPQDVIEAVCLVSRNLHPEDTYMGMIRKIAHSGNRLACLVKIADNAHNSRKDRVIPNATEEMLAFSANRYSRARKILYPAIPEKDVKTILSRINPELLQETFKG